MCTRQMEATETIVHVDPMFGAIHWAWQLFGDYNWSARRKTKHKSTERIRRGTRWRSGWIQLWRWLQCSRTVTIEMPRKQLGRCWTARVCASSVFVAPYQQCCLSGSYARHRLIISENKNRLFCQQGGYRAGLTIAHGSSVTVQCENPANNLPVALGQ